MRTSIDIVQLRPLPTCDLHDDDYTLTAHQVSLCDQSAINERTTSDLTTRAPQWLWGRGSDLGTVNRIAWRLLPPSKFGAVSLGSFAPRFQIPSRNSVLFSSSAPATPPGGRLKSAPYLCRTGPVAVAKDPRAADDFAEVLYSTNINVRSSPNFIARVQPDGAVSDSE